MSMRKHSTILLLVFGLALLTSSASANSLFPTVLDFSSRTLTGTNVTGGTAGLFQPGERLQILNAPIESVFPFYGGFHPDSIVNGYVDLITGDCVVNCSFYNHSLPTGVQFSDTGSSFQLYGSIPALPGDPHGLLFAAVFEPVGSVAFGEAHCGPNTTLTVNRTGTQAGLGTCMQITGVNPTLRADFNYPPYFETGYGFVQQLYIDLSLAQGFSGIVQSSDISIEPLPEPASLALLGMGLLGLGTLVRRTLIKK